MYLLKINRKAAIIENDGVYAIEEFKQVLDARGYGNKALLWVAYMADYDSPYRHFSENERARMISKDLFEDYEWKGVSNAKIQAALDKYKQLQFDPLDAQLIAFNEKINEYTALMDITTINLENAKTVQDLMLGIDKILKTRQNLLDAIERRGERSQIAGDKEMSYLERMQQMQNG
jgi:hypothetical protein